MPLNTFWQTGADGAESSSFIKTSKNLKPAQKAWLKFLTAKPWTKSESRALDELAVLVRLEAGAKIALGRREGRLDRTIRAGCLQYRWMVKTGDPLFGATELTEGLGITSREWQRSYQATFDLAVCIAALYHARLTLSG